MHVIRQDHPRIDSKRPALANQTNRFPEKIDVPHQQIGAAIKQVHGEEVRRTLDPDSSVLGHERKDSVRLSAECVRIPPYK